jgi:hypothetical protein
MPAALVMLLRSPGLSVAGIGAWPSRTWRSVSRVLCFTLQRQHDRHRPSMRSGRI